MDRLLVLRLEASGCTAEAVLNGIPLARTSAAQGVVLLPVHEYTLAGPNELELVIEPGAPGAVPAPEPHLSEGQAWASVRLLLPRVGSIANPSSARTLAQIDWGPPADEVYETPLVLRSRVELPIAFPRWRWLDAPPVEETPTLKQELAAYLLPIAIGLTRGNPEPFVQATRLRLEDHASAYQRSLADEVGRLRVHLLGLHAEMPLKPALPSAAKLMLRRVAGGRLVECLAGDGTAILASDAAGGVRIAWPLRVAMVEGKFYVLR